MDEWEDPYRGRTAEQPEYADRNPAGEELLAEDVSRSVHGHWPQDYQGQRHEDRDRPCDGRGFLELGLFGVRLGGLGGRFDRGPVVDGHGALAAFDVDAGAAHDAAVVDLADVPHRDPVVVLAAEGKGQDGDEDKGTAERGDVACQHGIAIFDQSRA